jgi:hypothetical protein
MVHQLNIVLDGVRSSIQNILKPKSTKLPVNKNSSKSCSPQSNINSSGKKVRYNQHDNGIEESNIIFDISEDEDLDNTTSKIPSVHTNDSSYQHISVLKSATSTLSTPIKQMKKVSPKPINRRTRQGVCTQS